MMNLIIIFTKSRFKLKIKAIIFIAQKVDSISKHLLMRAKTLIMKTTFYLPIL